MSGFIAGSACRGSRPKEIVLKDKFLREDLVTKLMSQRDVLRFINAPKGFGKSVLAAQYADVVFSFKDVFWINCQSPCFIRDLDKLDIVQQIIQICPETNLVVFDDLLQLNEDRTRKLSQTIDELLEYGCETILISNPQNVSICEYQPDCLILNSKNLLLKDNEFIKKAELNKHNNINNIDRIPLVAWGGASSVEKLLECSLSENFTNSINFALFIIYLLKSGSLSILEKYLSKSDVKLLKEFYSSYYYFGIDKTQNKFEVKDVSLSVLISLFYIKNDSISSIVKCKNKEQMLDFLLNLLKEENYQERATELVKFLGNKSYRSKYLETINHDSVLNLYLSSTCNLYDTIYVSSFDHGLNQCYQALRLAILGKKREAIRYSYSVLDKNTTSIDNKLFAALIFLRFGQDNEKFQAMKLLRYFNSDFKIENFLKDKKLDSDDKFRLTAIKRCLDVYLSIFSESFDPFKAWIEDIENEPKDTDLIAAEIIFSSMPYIRQKHIDGEYAEKFIFALSRYYTNLFTNKLELNFYSFAVIDSYLNNIPKIAGQIGEAPWTIEKDVYDKYTDYRKIFKSEKEKISDYIERPITTFAGEESFNDKDLLSNKLRTYSEILPQNVINVSNVPKLKINIFGGLSASIGDDEVLRCDFGRQNIKLLCCILVIENGHEINKEKLSALIWPGIPENSQRLNINTHWSVLRKLFSFENGECPYLTRSQNSYKLNRRFFESDLQMLESLCAEFTLGQIDSQLWYEKVLNNPNIFESDLLPSENSNSYILNKRIEYKTKIVNALVAASQRLLEAGEVQQSLWFATKALSKDASREDVYLAMMNAQLKAGQRSPAIETYMACTKFLSEEMGMEPCKRIKNLYQKILDDNVVI